MTREEYEKRRRALSFSDVDQILADACLRIVNLISAKSMRSVSWISRQAAVMARVVIPMLAGSKSTASRFRASSPSCNSLLQDRNVRGRNRRRHRLHVGIDVGEFLIGHYLCAIRRHAAWRRVPNVRGKSGKCKFRLSKTGPRESALSHRPMTLIAPITHENAFPIRDIARLRLCEHHHCSEQQRQKQD